MIFLAGAALILAIIGFYQRIGSLGLGRAALDLLFSALLGWFAGILIGIGARIGMWAIPFFNDVESRFTLDGTLQVIFVFSLFGIGLAVLYEMIFRRVLQHKGWLFGILTALVAAHPLGMEGVELLNFAPPLMAAAFFTGLIVTAMFVPYSMLLEYLLRQKDGLVVGCSAKTGAKAP